MKSAWLLVVAGTVLCLPARATALSCLLPEPLQTFSPQKTFRFRWTLSPTDVASEGTLERVQSKGAQSYQAIWSRTLVDHQPPRAGVVSRDGQHVALLDHGNDQCHQTRNPLTLYGPAGDLVADHQLVDFLLPQEMQRLEKAPGDRWYECASFQRHRGKPVLVVEVAQRDERGRRLKPLPVRFDATTGKPLRSARELQALDAHQATCRRLSDKPTFEYWAICQNDKKPYPWCSSCLLVAAGERRRQRVQ